MDSPAPKETILEGVPRSVSNNPVVRATVRALLASYFRLFQGSVTRHYRQGAESFETNPTPPPAPLLILYSAADLIAPSWKLDSVVVGWERLGVTVHVQKWEDSPHVGHLRRYPEQYAEALRVFLGKLGLAARGRL